MNRDTFDRLVASGDDFEICNQVFTAAAKIFGNVTDLSIEPWPSITVTVVWHSNSLIHNGGFKRLLEVSFKGDEQSVFTAESYKEIGAFAAHNAWLKLFGLFPRREIPADCDARLEQFEQTSEPVVDSIEELFLGEEQSITASLAGFIRINGGALVRLLS